MVFMRNKIQRKRNGIGNGSAKQLSTKLVDNQLLWQNSLIAISNCYSVTLLYCKLLYNGQVSIILTNFPARGQGRQFWFIKLLLLNNNYYYLLLLLIVCILYCIFLFYIHSGSLIFSLLHSLITPFSISNTFSLNNRPTASICKSQILKVYSIYFNASLSLF